MALPPTQMTFTLLLKVGDASSTSASWRSVSIKMTWGTARAFGFHRLAVGVFGHRDTKQIIERMSFRLAETDYLESKWCWT